MDYRIEPLKKGLWKHKRSPNLIRKQNLSTYIRECENIYLLIKEMAYSLTTDIENRVLNREVWAIAYNSCSFPDWKLKIIIGADNYSSLEDLLIVDISIIDSKQRETFFKKHPYLKIRLIQELVRISKHGQ